MRDFSQDCDIEQEVDRQTACPLLASLNQYIVHACKRTVRDALAERELLKKLSMGHGKKIQRGNYLAEKKSSTALVGPLAADAHFVDLNVAGSDRTTSRDDTNASSIAFTSPAL